MTATSGRICCVLFNVHTPLGCLLKTLMSSPLWYSMWFRLTWKPKATKCGRLYFQLARSERRTFGLEPSLWRTPQAADHKSAKTQQGYQLNLTHQVLWPTPVARDYKRPGPGSRQLHLSNAVRMWPTPTAIDAGSGRSNRSASPNAQARPTLALMARKGLWPTPTANDARTSTLPPAALGRARLPGTVKRSRETGNLNPEWAEALMGLPIGWTALAGPLHQDTHNRSGNPLGPSEAKGHTMMRD
jgi:hypothetical protein